MVARLFLIVFAMLLAGHAEAGPKETADQIDQAVKTWMTNNAIASAAAAVSFEGKTEGSYAYGGWSPDTDYPVASLSKAITGVCVAKLINDGKLSLTDTVGKILVGYFKTHPAPTDTRMLSITIEDLLTHRSGLEKNTFGDAHTIVAAVQNTLASTLMFAPGTKFSYSDSGYLLVGYLADQANGQSYFKTCAPVLSSVEAAGVIDGTMRERAPNGGWDISANNYIKFLRYFRKGSSYFNPQMEAFVRSPPNKGGYSLGAFIKHSSAGTILTHTGLVHHDKTHPKTGGSYYIVTENGYAVVVIFSGENSGTAYNTLDAEITKVLLTNSVNAPPAAGAATEIFTARIEGKPWAANSVISAYSTFGGKAIFNLSARLMTKPESFFTLNIYLPPGFTGGTLTLAPGKPLQTNHGGFNSDAMGGDVLANGYTFQSATIVVDHYDAARKTMSGYFEGILKNHNGDKILHVTDGKFSGISYDPALMK